MSVDTPGPDSTANETTPLFTDLGLDETVLKAVQELGYAAPSPIQAATIPAMLAGRDVLGQAQTGTGKTAAFALPVISRLQRSGKSPAALVLAPTRELAIQVAEAFQRYAVHRKGFHVLPIYGGQAYGGQLAGLKRGADVVVGTPGRVIDHITKGTLKLDELQTLVLDEADEMLRMGFIDDVQSVLELLPESAQVALFSATMPDPIRRIANTHLTDPVQVTIKTKTSTAPSIRQRYWVVAGMHKLDALTRMLEVEPFDGMLVFARTRVATEELAQKLAARGFSTAALNGDVPQKNREQIVEKLKNGQVDILVATDVAARGLDVERVSHVVNYDIPYDTEAYVHRIGRTGRAGRSGDAILFVAPRERNMLRAIERATRQPIEAMALPTISDVNETRVARFKASVKTALESDELPEYRKVVADLMQTLEVGAEELAAALARLARGDDHLLLAERNDPAARKAGFQHDDKRGPRSDDGRQNRPPSDRPRKPRNDQTDADKTRYRIAVGHTHGVGPGNIVGAIANEANLDSGQIGRIDIQESFSLVDLPSDLSGDVLQHLAKVRVAGQALRLSPDRGPSAGHKPPYKAGGKPPRGKPSTRPAKPSASATDKPRGKPSPRDGDKSTGKPAASPKKFSGKTKYRAGDLDRLTGRATLKRRKD